MNSTEKHDLNALIAAEPTSAKPDLLFREGGVTTLYLNLPPGSGMPEHDHVGCQVTLLCLRGEANVVIDGESHTLPEGQLISFNGQRRVEPRNDSAAPCGLLITLAETVAAETAASAPASGVVVAR